MDLVTFTIEILNGKLHFLCSVDLQLFQKQTPAQLLSCNFVKFFRALVAHKVVFQSTFVSFLVVLTRLPFTYSESTRETLEKVVKHV